MERRTASWYSVVRYIPNNLTGEVINVGLIMHSVEGNSTTKYLLLQENSPKIKAITNTQTDINTYKTFKDSLEYYLKKSTEDIFGVVGEVQIASPLEPNFLKELCEYYKGKSLYLSQPKFSFSGNIDALFKALFQKYVGDKYLVSEYKETNIKKYMKSIFEERMLLNNKVVHDFNIRPIEDLDSLKIHVDFGYKNGVWNYLQAVPNLNSPSKSAEWFAKIRFMFDQLKHQDARIHLMFRESDITGNQDVREIINYLAHSEERIIRLNLDNHQSVDELCSTIERDAHDIKDLMIS
ncbi:DUF3037 domain-containing protein [Bacillus cereus]|uniref:DUF3037 domain-containing protein n=1 Tax=Bacillus cereus TaxID=1396 RepID=UPI001483734D|nr:DUF3037 domain-containing protein [Bacillus cereus]